MLRFRGCLHLHNHLHGMHARPQNLFAQCCATGHSRITWSAKRCYILSMMNSGAFPRRSLSFKQTHFKARCRKNGAKNKWPTTTEGTFHTVKDDGHEQRRLAEQVFWCSRAPMPASRPSRLHQAKHYMQADGSVTQPIYPPSMSACYMRVG